MKFSYQWLKELVSKFPPKAKLAEVLNLYSFETENKVGDLLEISIPPNRFSDAACHLGIAREAAAVLGLQFPAQKIRTAAGGKNSKSIKIQIEDNNLCPRYCAKVIKGIRVGPSPKWLSERLMTCGLRPVNNIVDAMNYAMLETGQPLHAFDVDKLKDGIVVRKAKGGEKIITLDNEEYKLDEDILVIADSGNILAIAGIKGGRKAEITDKTKNIVIEAATFDPTNIYLTSKKIKLTTDASLRFSHGLSPELAPFAIQRVAELVLELAGGKAEEGLIDIYNPKNFAGQRDIFEINFANLNKFLGIEIAKKRIRSILELLGFEILKDSSDSLRLRTPLFRMDLTDIQDVYEEIVRIYGYNNLPSLPPKAFLAPAEKDEMIEFSDQIRILLKSLGFCEVYNYSFVGDKDFKGSDFSKENLVELENPAAENKKYLRPSLSTLLIKNAEDNSRFFDEIKIFEIGKIFLKERNKTFKEILNLSAILAGKMKPP